MKKILVTTMVIVASIALTAGIVNAAARHNVTSQFGPAGDIFQVDGTMKMNSVMIGAQDVGGVTYFNGSIVNDTTTSGADNPVTFGDNMRLDGRLWRGSIAGPGDGMPFIVNDDMEVTGDLTVDTDLAVSGDAAVDGTLTAGDLLPAADATYSLGTTTVRYKDVYTSGTVKIDGAIVGDSIIDTGLITDGTIATADIADDAVTPDKINGTGGANLPIAYGWCNDDGTTRGGTSNVSCSWNAVQYEITITGVDYDYREYIAFATPVDSGMIPAVSSVGGKFVVDFTTHAGVGGQQADFQFIIYDM